MSKKQPRPTTKTVNSGKCVIYVTISLLNYVSKHQKKILTSNWVKINKKNIVREWHKLIRACEKFFSHKIVIFSKFSIFDSKFLENYISDFQTKICFKRSRAHTFKWYIVLVPTMKFNFSALWLVKIFWHFFFAQNFWNIHMKLLYILIFAKKIP